MSSLLLQIRSVVRHAPSPVLRAPSPVRHAASMVRHAPSPVHHAASMVRHAPSPVHHAPSLVRRAPSPVHHAPSLVRRASWQSCQVRYLTPALLLALFLMTVPVARSQTITTRFESSGGRESPPYDEIVAWWKKLDEQSGKVKMLTMGATDAGYPLNLVVVSNNGDYDFNAIRSRNKRIILINNGIHPGEPDGIDASMLLVRDIVTKKITLPDNVVLAIIPVYNIGGCLNRSADYRVDQNGPVEFGFRGNSQNLDLNRDFIKGDSKDARAFMELFRMLDPDVFVDNHVSDGADYQHVMTLLPTQHDKLGGTMAEYMNKTFEPAMHAQMKTRGFDLIPYVNFWGSNRIQDGWDEFWDSPRYSTGYAALFNCFSFMPETHMLKPYDQRVNSAYALMQTFIAFTSANSEEIHRAREQAKQETLTAAAFPVKWEMDRSQASTIHFKGYESGMKTSEVSGLPRFFYDRGKPYTADIPFYNHYKATMTIETPGAYIVPQGWWKVIELLKLNKVKMGVLRRDTTMTVEVYHIDDYKSGNRPYEGHHLNLEVKVTKSTMVVKLRKGDVYIPMDQAANRYIFETLEPQGEDSFFAWNFFDPILAQKEGYSAYSFEDIAADYLRNNPELTTKIENRKTADSAFANSAAAQLNYVYQQSPWIEPAYLRYPVYRVAR